jgi:hypothetical protein
MNLRVLAPRSCIQSNQQLALNRLMLGIHCGRAMLPYQVRGRRLAREAVEGCAGLHSNLGALEHSLCVRLAWATVEVVERTTKTLQTGRPGFDFPFSVCVQTGCRAHPASWPMGMAWGCSAAGAWRWPLTSIWCRGQERVWAIPPLPSSAFMACSVTPLLYHKIFDYRHVISCLQL